MDQTWLIDAGTVSAAGFSRHAHDTNPALAYQPQPAFALP